MTRSVLVVGAGIAGLSAAYALRQAGFAVTVFEASGVAGGRMTERRDGPIVYNTGARLLYPFSRPTMGLIDALGLTDALVEIRNLAGRSRAGGVDYTVELMPGPRTLRSPVLGLRDKAGLARLALDFLLWRGRTDPDDLATAATADDETVADYVARKGSRAVHDLMIEPVFRGARSWNTDEISAAFLLTTASHLVGRNHVYGFRGGIGRLAEALAETLEVRLNTPVVNIRPLGDRCAVATSGPGGERRFEFDRVVCAVEGARVPALVELDADEAAFFAGVRYNSLGVVHYALSHDVTPGLTFIPRAANSRLATYQQLPAAPAAGRQAAQLYCQLTPEATRSARQHGDTQDLDRLIRDDVRACYPGIDRDVTHVANQWIDYKLPVPYPGYAARLRRFRDLQAARPRLIYFCGDYLAQALATGACRSGLDTAALIARHWG